MQLTGAEVHIIERCTPSTASWGLRKENVELARRVAKPLMERVRESTAGIVAGDCQLANVAITKVAGSDRSIRCRYSLVPTA